MNNLPNIVPITRARNELAELTKSVSGEKYVLLTRGGEPVVAMVDPKYLAKLMSDVVRVFKKTYLDTELVPYTREFNESEIAEWLEEDKI